MAKIMQAAEFETRFPASARVKSGLTVKSITCFEDIDGVFFEGIILQDQLSCTFQHLWIEHRSPLVDAAAGAPGRARVYRRACKCRGCTWRNRRATGSSLDLILEEVWGQAVLLAPPQCVAPAGVGAATGSIAIAARSEGADPAEGVASAVGAAPAEAAAAAHRQNQVPGDGACEDIARAAFCDLSGIIRNAVGALGERTEHRLNSAVLVPRASKNKPSSCCLLPDTDSQPPPNRPASRQPAIAPAAQPGSTTTGSDSTRSFADRISSRAAARVSS